jgi:hypothetical protein
MPKRWRIVLTLFDDEGNELTSDSHTERYNDEAEARAKFDEKDRAAKGAGKGSPGDEADEE